MGYISSTCTSLTPITNTNGQWSATDVSFSFNDPEGTSFTMTHGSGSYGYQGLRTNAKYKYFRMSYEWYGGTGGYLGPFWGNQSSTYIGGGGGYASGYKTIHYPDSGGVFNVRLRSTVDNQDRETGINTSFSQSDSNWHTTVIEVMPYCVRQSIDGVEQLIALYQNTQSIVDTVGDEIAKEGYCGLLWYSGQYQIKNFKVEPIELPKSWEHFATYSGGSATTSIDMTGILKRNDAGYAQVKLVIENLIPDTNGTELRVRLLDSGGSERTDSAYYGACFATSHGASTNTNGTGGGTVGTLYYDMWSNDRGGVHGEILISNFGITPFTVLNNSIQRGSGTGLNHFRPIMHSILTGYDPSAEDNNLNGYTRQDAWVRYNNAQTANNHTGIKLFTSSGGFEKDYIINVYGLRSPVA